MKKTMIPFMQIVALFSNAPTHAQVRFHPHPRPCRTYTETRDRVEAVHFTGSCYLSDPLELSRTEQYLPGLQDTLSVPYWKGAYARNATEDVSRSIVTYDCYGSEIHRAAERFSKTVEIAFNVKNPNLSEQVTTSFEANAPMTDAEAAQALKDAEQACLQSK